MPLCNINLAEGLIWPRWKRLMAYRLMVVYLIGMIVLLASMAGRGVKEIGESIRLYRQSQAIEKNFSKQQQSSTDLRTHAQSLKNQIERSSAQAVSINAALPNSLRTSLPALVLLANQPEHALLNELSFAQQTEKTPPELLFSLVTPVTTNSTTSAATRLIDQWKNDVALAAQFPDVSQTLVRRVALSGESVFITQYKALSKD